MSRIGVVCPESKVSIVFPATSRIELNKEIDGASTVACYSAHMTEARGERPVRHDYRSRRYSHSDDNDDDTGY